MTDIAPLNAGPTGRRRKLKSRARERTLDPDKIRLLGTIFKDLALITLSVLVLCAFAIWSIGLVNGAL